MRKPYRRISKVSQLEIVDSVLQSILSRVMETPFKESCGFLTGTVTGSHVKVISYQQITNISDVPDRFSFHPGEQLDFERESSGDLQIVGIFHSHQKEPELSRLDIETMHLYPVIWLVIGQTITQRLEDVVVKAFYLDQHNLVQKIEFTGIEAV